MSKIQQLQQQVQDIENSVDETMSKEELYDKLIIAYTHLKDIIALMGPNVPITQDKALETRLRDAEDALLKADSLAAELQLEVNSLQKTLTEKNNYIANMKQDREKYKIIQTEQLEAKDDIIAEWQSIVGQIYQLIPAKAK